MARASAYAKITAESDPGNFGAWKEITEKAKRFFCNAVNHHQDGGCPNPDCFRHVEGVEDHGRTSNKRR